jgi:DNA-binding MarR family transcriptional regulator
VLVDAGLLDMEKGYDGKRPRTWVSITTAGRQALAAEIAALRALVARHDI